MAFSLACDAGKTTLRIEGTDTDVTFDDVYSEGAGSVDVDGGGTEDVDFFITEYIAEIYYVIKKNIIFGDESNILTFNSANESIYWNDECGFHIADNSTLNIGTITDGYASAGASWSYLFQGGSSSNPVMTNYNATCNIAGSVMHARGMVGSSSWRIYFNYGTIKFINSIFSSIAAESYGMVKLGHALTSSIVEGVYFTNSRGLALNAAPDILTDVWFNNTRGIDYASGQTIRITNMKWSNVVDLSVIANSNSTLEFVNPVEHVIPEELFFWPFDNATIKARELYTSDVLVTDSDNVPIENAVVIHSIASSIDGGSSWGDYVYVNTYTTDINGLTGENDYDYEQWAGSNLITTVYRHRLEIVASGSPDVVVDNIRPAQDFINVQIAVPAFGIFFHGSRKRISY